MGNKKGTRHANRRKLEQAIGNIRSAQDYVVFVGKQYEGTYSDIYESACMLVNAFESLAQAMDAFRDEL